METQKKNNKRNQRFFVLISALALVTMCQVLFFRCGQMAPRNDEKITESIKITCRDYLLRGAYEEAGFGLYSYVLFSRKSADRKELERYIMMHRAYRTLHSRKDYEYAIGESTITKQNVNMSYWPLQVSSGDSSYAPDSLEARPDSSQFFVDNYDYVRADLILKRYKGMNARGPFIVACYYPLSHLPQNPEKSEMLIIDFSRIDNDRFVEVFDYFQKKVLDDPKTWQGKFDWELIKIHFYSALTLHGKPVLFAAKWVGDFFDVKKAFAGQ